MKNNKIKKETYSKIEMPFLVEEKILNNTIYKSRISKKHFQKILVPLIILICFSSTFVFAILKNYFITETTSSRILTLSGKKVIKEKSYFKCQDSLLLTNIEKELAISLLLHSENTAQEFEQCEIIYDDFNNVRRIFLGNKLFYDFQGMIDIKNKRDKIIELEIFFMTQYATLEDEKIFENAIQLSGGEDVKEMFEKNFIINLNTEVYIVKFNDDGYYPITFCFFVFDNVLYNFKGKNVSKEEILDFISYLKLK